MVDASPIDDETREETLIAVIVIIIVTVVVVVVSVASIRRGRKSWKALHYPPEITPFILNSSDSQCVPLRAQPMMDRGDRC